MSQDIQKAVDAGIEAFHDEAKRWMPKERLRQTWYVKWREGTKEKSVAFGTEALAVQKAGQVLAGAVDEVFLVLQIKKA